MTAGPVATVGPALPADAEYEQDLLRLPLWLQLARGGGTEAANPDAALMIIRLMARALAREPALPPAVRLFRDDLLAIAAAPNADSARKIAGSKLGVGLGRPGRPPKRGGLKPVATGRLRQIAAFLRTAALDTQLRLHFLDAIVRFLPGPHHHHRYAQTLGLSPALPGAPRKNVDRDFRIATEVAKLMQGEGDRSRATFLQATLIVARQWKLSDGLVTSIYTRNERDAWAEVARQVMERGPKEKECFRRPRGKKRPRRL